MAKIQSPVIMPRNRIPRVPSVARSAVQDVSKDATDEAKLASMMGRLKTARNMK